MDGKREIARDRKEEVNTKHERSEYPEILDVA